MRKTIKNTFALAALLLAGTTPTVSAQSTITEKEGTIIQTEQRNGGLKIYTVQDENTGNIFKSIPMQAQFAIGNQVDYTIIVNLATSGNGTDVKDAVVKVIRK